MSLTVNDSRPDLTGTCTSAGAAVNLTGATLALHIRRPDGTVLTKPAAVTAPLTGAWSYRWAAGDLNAAGNYSVEAQVTYADGGVQTFGPQTFYVQGELA